MTKRSAICLVIDRLPAHLMGAYGNAWINTPSLDALAAESLVCDFAMIDSPNLQLLYRSYWHGLHAATQTAAGLANACPVVERLQSLGGSAQLLTDETLVAALPGARHFDKILELPALQQAETAESVAETGLGLFFAGAADAVEKMAAGSLLWLHCRGLGGPWDAPLELRNVYAAEDDPPPPTTTAVSGECLLPDHDPDARLGIAQAAAGQVTALDECLEMFLDAFLNSPQASSTLLIVVGSRGLPLGEHLWIGPTDGPLYEELVHVPLFLRLPGAGAVPQRSNSLVQPADVYHTLTDWFGGAEAEPGRSAILEGASLLALAEDPRRTLRDRAVAIGDLRNGDLRTVEDNSAGNPANGPHHAEWAIRTPAWYLRCSARAAGESQELFVKPDDRFEQNDVARRCTDVVEQLTIAADDFFRAAQSTSGLADVSLAPLDDMLVNGPA